MLRTDGTTEINIHTDCLLVCLLVCVFRTFQKITSVPVATKANTSGASTKISFFSKCHWHALVFRVTLAFIPTKVSRQYNAPHLQKLQAGNMSQNVALCAWILQFYALICHIILPADHCNMNCDPQSVHDYSTLLNFILFISMH